MSMKCEKISGIYKIISKIDGKYYIGSSKDISGSHGRWYIHKLDLNKHCHHNEYLQNAWNKHGQKNFDFVIIEKTSDLLNREQYYLDLAFQEKDKCYNLLFSAYRLKLTPEIRQKISESLIGRFKGKESPHWGKNHTLESRKKISNALKGRISPNKGKSMCSEQKEKISRSVLKGSQEIKERKAKNWMFTSPEKDIIKIHNLNQFCKDNNLQVSKMWCVANGIRPHHKGWTKC
jgi:group I intron endonuclease